MPLDDRMDQNALEAAHEALENTSWHIQLANLIGKPVEFILTKLPKKAGEAVERATNSALQAALKLALSSMNRKKRAGASPWLHRGIVTLSGGIGGAVGLPGLAIELPLSTVIMLRSIADIARAEGEDLESAEPCLACLEVFALCGHSTTDDAAESSYFTVRAALARAVSEAASYVVEKGVAEEGAPVLIRLVTKISQRFAPAVTDKVAAQAAPVIGAIGGAGVNLVFIAHFQSVAQGHFTVRRLERKYGKDRIQQAYEELSRRL